MNIDGTKVAYALETLSPFLAFWIGLLFMGVGFYIVFPCERRDGSLMAFGFGSALLGYIIFVLLRPESWVPAFFTVDVIRPLALILLFFGGIHMTYLVWQHYDLKPPHKRLLEIAFKWRDRGRYACHVLLNRYGR